jgi:hypothetical protein
MRKHILAQFERCHCGTGVTNQIKLHSWIQSCLSDVLCSGKSCNVRCVRGGGVSRPDGGFVFALITKPVVRG